MKKFYKRAKIFIAVCWVILSAVLIPACIYSAVAGEVLMAVLCLFMEAFGTLTCVFLLYYYGNIVIDVSFSGENTVIQTNIKTYTLPSDGFYEVADSKGLGRIFIKYADQHGKKTFVFQKQYSPLHKYSLDLNLMRKNMLRARFKKE